MDTVEDYLRSISAIPSLFGWLVYLADLLKDRGKQNGMAATLDELQARIFREWLGLSLEQQFEDLECYCSDRPDWLEAIRDWIDNGSYRRLIPIGVRPAEAEVFLSDMAILAPLLDPGEPTPESGI